MSTSESTGRAETAGAHGAAPPPFPDLDWSPERARELAEAVVELWTELLGELPELPVTRGESQQEVSEAVAIPVPEGPLPVEELVEHLRTVIAHETHIGHPRFLAYIIGSGTVPGAAAELLSAGAVQNAGGWMISPAAHEVERRLVRWLADELGLPETAGGLFVTGGAIGNLVGLKLARDQRAGWDVRHAGLTGPPLAIYTSAEAHDTIDRAADILGLGAAAVRKIDVDGELRMRPDALEARLAEDLKSGSRPIAVVGTAGTTGTGSIDPLPELAAICARAGLWFHVDAAYGGPAALAEDLRPMLAGIEHADSVTFDAHKWLYSSAPAGCIIARHEHHLAESFAVDASYIYEDKERTGRGVNAASLAPTFSRGFDALKVWLALLAHGRAAFARRISHDAALARYLGGQIEARPDFELAAPVSLSISCFRYRPPDLPVGTEAETYLDRLNERLLTELQLDGRVFPSNAVVHGRFALRTCITNIRTEADDLDMLLDVAAELGERLDAELRPAALRSEAP
jgi:glutamate/tyrosine decarboxylase-like PLP-dependent enzyme